MGLLSKAIKIGAVTALYKSGVWKKAFPSRFSKRGTGSGRGGMRSHSKRHV
jgi:hypothetical protein